MKNNCKCSKVEERLGKVGGQAVIEGVMMKAGNRTVTTCRKEDGSIVVNASDFNSIRSKHKILDLPIIRGVVNFIEMMMLSVKTLGASAEALGIEEEEPGKFEKWLREKLGVRIVDFIMGVSVVLGMLLAVLLFVCLPGWIANGIDFLLGYFLNTSLGAWRAVLEGVVKIGIFISYLLLVSLMPDIKRTFMYHGAEHKSIACFEAGDELTPENAKKHTRFHPRCGTSFMFFMILLGIFAGFFIHTVFPGLHWLLYSLIRILILPILMGVGYEIIRIAGKHDNVVTRVLSAPGIWAQGITTKEPDEGMLEVAIISLKCALRDSFPEFMEFYNDKPWEPKTETVAEGDTDAENAGVDSAEAEAKESASESTEAAADSGGESQNTSASREQSTSDSTTTATDETTAQTANSIDNVTDSLQNSIDSTENSDS